jgi:hypothetical protein
MTSTSSTPKSWDARCRHLFGLSSTPTEVDPPISIDINELLVGDQILITNEPFIVIGIQPEGPMISVEALSENRVITNDYLQIERVEVLSPRPPAATNRKVYR